MKPDVAALAEDPDLALLQRVRQHDDRQAFGLLVRRHQGVVRALLRRLARGDAAWADELAQEAFLRAYQNLGGFRGEARFRTWLIRIATNVFLEQRRRGDAQLQAQTQALNDETEQHQIAAGGMAQADHALSLSDTVALSLDVQRALDVLSEAERQAIVLSYWGDLSHAEAALALGCPLGTLKTHLLRGRAKLETALAAWGPCQPLEQCK
ncbi:RNA polymerase sigma-70 factor (ECF subfamily) [Collimonas sp. PA-H2]|uniref:RNA polymerase sigma factor n=1 Tax=Collimonas sp. PA-H2 TaxID=1881062 RepID=UPI000BF41F14|nr:sigma-70 family RNA polymerase sigma factor [Collimonas sp. PA-H2]PFH08891.1 RNA polymerase sigma-70 factor (ECF subfamily) [Collimonas sp. PA-H2]